MRDRALHQSAILLALFLQLLVFGHVVLELVHCRLVGFLLLSGRRGLFGRRVALVLLFVVEHAFDFADEAFLLLCVG